MKNPKQIADEIDALHRDLTFELQRRDRPDRHPYQVGILSAILIMAIAQIALGLPSTSALRGSLSYATMVALDVAFIIGSALALWGAAVNRSRHFLLSVRLGMYGHLSTFTASLIYALIVIVATEGPGSKPYWLAVTSVMLTLGLAYASVHRFIQMRSLHKEYLRRRQPQG